MPPGEQGNQRRFDDRFMAHDYFPDFGSQAGIGLPKGLNGLFGAHVPI